MGPSFAVKEGKFQANVTFKKPYELNKLEWSDSVDTGNWVPEFAIQQLFNRIVGLRARFIRSVAWRGHASMRSPADRCQCQWLTCNFEARLGIPCERDCSAHSPARRGLQCPLAGEAGPTRTRTRTPSRRSYPRGRRRTDQKHRPINSRAAGPPLESGSSDRRLRLGAGVLVGALVRLPEIPEASIRGLHSARGACARAVAGSRRALHSSKVRSGQVRYITRPKSRTMRVTRQLMLPPSTVTYVVVSRACSANKAQAIARCWDRSFPWPIALPHGHRGEWAAMPTSAPRYVPESPNRGRTTRSCF
jgi:hypothetical protein